MTDNDQTRVLHVDDDADIREITLLALETVGGMNVVSVGSGQAALDALDSFTPDVFLLDYMMPEMSGEELYQQLQLRPEIRDVPCIFMTARVQSSEVVALEALGAKAVIEKPFDPMTLADKIRAVL